jgi:hypothetical protein
MPDEAVMFKKLKIVCVFVFVLKLSDLIQNWHFVSYKLRMSGVVYLSDNLP